MTSSDWIEAIFCIAQKFRLVQTAVARRATVASGGKATGGEAAGIFCGPLFYLKKVQFTPLNYSQSLDNPQTITWFNLPPKLCHLVYFTP